MRSVALGWAAAATEEQVEQVDPKALAFRRSHARAGEPKLVVVTALLRIAQDVVGFFDVLELLFRFPIAPVDVGMVFASQCSKGFADFVQARVPGDR